MKPLCQINIYHKKYWYNYHRLLKPSLIRSYGYLIVGQTASVNNLTDSRCVKLTDLFQTFKQQSTDFQSNISNENAFIRTNFDTILIMIQTIFKQKQLNTSTRLSNTLRQQHTETRFKFFKNNNLDKPYRSFLLIARTLDLRKFISFVSLINFIKIHY